ncbi:NTE family protein [Mariniphaga anaerophila]|uniref:NTE family protein n=1 Tax=Mariniphaga anaerophila TaxID=1484053 RepID=A0A1M5CHR6_9BACT|nr:patatin-like phospholipase family protein [Mariniphaga anaerophila]SHF54314.1 NTE family protein [Mariniphaga anaerophila]
MRKFFLLFVITALFFSAGAQNKRPKVGLVLSGGGAKGIAHIGVLKAMEEAGLTPDYITGTSMGSIIGGLYSIGYSADELSELVTTINWDQVLTNKIPLDKITFEEKPYYGRYLLDFYLENKEIRYPSGVIEGQTLMDIFSDLTRPVHNINSFSNFPIPFACVATNIATGEAVVLNKGSLATAMRASMAIPTVFTPITIDGNLLVDGGLVRNMPVSEVIDMGADIIIGVFVSSDLDSKPELNSFVSILAQSALIGSVIDSKEQVKKCNVLVKPNLEGFSTGSFNSAEGILERGMEAGEQYVDVFRHLADSLKKIGPLHEVKKPEIKTNYVFQNIEIDGNKFVTDDFIIGKMDFEPGQLVSVDEIRNHINLMFGTQYFEKIQYEILGDEGDYTLKVIVVERPRTHFRFSYLYDSENKGGILINTTFRNLFLKSSRLMVEGDFSAYPVVLLDYFKYVGKRQNVALGVSGTFVNSDLPLYEETGVVNSIFGSNYSDAAFKIQSTALRNSTYGLKFNWSLMNLHSKVANESLREISKVSYNSTRFSLFYEYNSWDDHYFPKKGLTGSVQFSATASTNGQIRISDVDYDIKDFDGLIETNTIKALRAQIEPIIPVSPKVVLLTKAKLMLSNVPANTLNLNEYDFVGGFTPDLVNATEYPGSGIKEFVLANYFYGRMGAQYEPMRNLFLQLHVNYLSTKFPISWIYPNAESAQLGLWNDRYSISGRIGFKSPLGPISLAVAKDNHAQKLKASLVLGFTY